MPPAIHQHFQTPSGVEGSYGRNCEFIGSSSSIIIPFIYNNLSSSVGNQQFSCRRYFQSAFRRRFIFLILIELYQYIKLRMLRNPPPPQGLRKLPCLNPSSVVFIHLNTRRLFLQAANIRLKSAVWGSAVLKHLRRLVKGKLVKLVKVSFENMTQLHPHASPRLQVPSKCSGTSEATSVATTATQRLQLHSTDSSARLTQRPPPPTDTQKHVMATTYRHVKWLSNH